MRRDAQISTAASLKLRRQERRRTTTGIGASEDDAVASLAHTGVLNFL